MGESVPLLPERMAARGGREVKLMNGGGATGWWRDLAREGGKVGRVALPMAAVSLSQYAVQVASNMMVGHLPGVIPLMPPPPSPHPSPQSQASASSYVKRYYTISFSKLLILIGQDPLISKETGRYIAWLIPALFAYAVSQPLTKFLQSQSLIIPMLWPSIATLLLHIPLCWLLVFKTSLGFIGASLAISLSYWLNVIMLAVYIRYSSACKETRSPPTVEAFKGVGLFLRLALPSALMLCFEWWSFEILILVSGLLPKPELQTSVLSICTRVANELGAGNPEGARSAVRIVMTIAALEASIITSSLLASQHIVGYAYSSDKEVVSYVNAMVPFVCVSVAADSLQGVLSGIARGSGWQHLGAYVNLGSFYLVGIPTALFLGFVLKMEGKGLWMGISCGSVVQFLLLAVITFFSNWTKMSEKARERVFSEELSDKEALESDGSVSV
ncbi:hypothetical protein PR202_gb02050 [Eleusine coracana subsp. coracana]|uniref:Protein DETOXIFICATION n=1 Tax=Eleusine coracana subsp. coracana TaxID=191504 RepID=A0AAV5DXI3_ELECO|nr:hypothetical protein PR202_gb02050 [Eleusine coracana subsp. coracana]